MSGESGPKLESPEPDAVIIDLVADDRWMERVAHDPVNVGNLSKRSFRDRRRGIASGSLATDIAVKLLSIPSAEQRAADQGRKKFTSGELMLGEE